MLFSTLVVETGLKTDTRLSFPLEETKILKNKIRFKALILKKTF